MNQNVNPDLYLFDGTLLVFRAMFGIPDIFHDPFGNPINGVRGYVTHLLNTLIERQVGHAAVAFDESLTTCWRNDVYPQYKANRPAADAAVMFQLDRCRSLTEALGIPVLANLRYEADDFIATLAQRSRGPVVIVSRDKDLQQLLSERVVILDPGKSKVKTAADFEAESGFPPHLFPDYQALTGDSVDNIPGVRGVGAKTASRLVQRFGALESIYAGESAWPEAGIKPGTKVAGNLQAERDRAFLFRSILRLERAADTGLPMEQTRLTPPGAAHVDKTLHALQLEGLLGRSFQQALTRYCV